MGIFTPFWMKAYPGKTAEQRKRAAEKIRRDLLKIDAITDEKKLIQIARETPAADFRKRAEEKITDQEALKELALKFQDDEALKRLTDQNALKEIALTTDSERKASIVIKAIDDDGFLTDLIDRVQKKSLPCLKDKGMQRSHLVISALLKIKDQDYLYSVASLNKFGIPFFEDEQDAAVHNLTDPEKLFLLAKSAKHQIAAAAISRIYDKEKLIWLAKHCDTAGVSPSVGQMAAMQMRGERFYTPKYR